MLVLTLNLIPTVFAAGNGNSGSKISMEEVKQAILDKKPNVVIVDVRDEASYAKGHIAGAINISHKKYDNFQNGQTEFPGLTKDGVNCVYCYVKECNLGEKAAHKFTALGYPSKDIVGGFDSWKDAGYPVESASTK